MAKNDNSFLIITFLCALMVFSIGLIAGLQISSSNVDSVNTKLSTCNVLLDYCSESHNSMPQNCSNPIYKSDNYYYCEVN